MQKQQQQTFALTGASTLKKSATSSQQDRQSRIMEPSQQQRVSARNDASLSPPRNAGARKRKLDDLDAHPCQNNFRSIIGDDDEGDNDDNMGLIRGDMDPAFLAGSLDLPELQQKLAALSPHQEDEGNNGAGTCSFASTDPPLQRPVSAPVVAQNTRPPSSQSLKNPSLQKKTEAEDLVIVHEDTDSDDNEEDDDEEEEEDDYDDDELDPEAEYVDEDEDEDDSYSEEEDDDDDDKDDEEADDDEIIPIVSNSKKAVVAAETYHLTQKAAAANILPPGVKRERKKADPYAYYNLPEVKNFLQDEYLNDVPDSERTAAIGLRDDGTLVDSDEDDMSDIKGVHSDEEDENDMEEDDGADASL